MTLSEQSQPRNKFENVAITGHFGFVIIEDQMVSIYTKTQSRRFKNSSSLKSVFEKLHFRDGLVWTGKPNRRKKAAFLNSSGLISVDGRPDGRNKAALLNFSGVSVDRTLLRLFNYKLKLKIKRAQNECSPSPTAFPLAPLFM